jgi:hypothetical protein
MAHGGAQTVVARRHDRSLLWPVMTRTRASLAPLVVLLVFCGVWVSHTLEYLRVEGTYALREEMTGSVHAYMLPVAGVLFVLAALTGAVWWRLWTSAGSQLERARIALAAALRNQDAGWARGRPLPVPSFASSLVLLWIPLSIAQLIVYVVQENVEYSAVGAPLPGLGVISGANEPALWIHVGVALALATLVTFLGRGLRDRVASATRSETLVCALLARLRRAPVQVAVPRPQHLPTPLERLGSAVWKRPPPGSALS